MDFKKPRGKPEKEGQTRLVKLMTREGWYCKKTHGSMFSQDWPDLFALHPLHGCRWVEMKTPTGTLSHGQIAEFSMWMKHGQGVWVCRDEKDYPFLFKEPNWFLFTLPANQRPL